MKYYCGGLQRPVHVASEAAFQPQEGQAKQERKGYSASSSAQKGVSPIRTIHRQGFIPSACKKFHLCCCASALGPLSLEGRDLLPTPSRLAKVGSGKEPTLVLVTRLGCHSDELSSSIMASSFVSSLCQLSNIIIYQFTLRKSLHLFISKNINTYTHIHIYTYSLYRHEHAQIYPFLGTIHN